MILFKSNKTERRKNGPVVTRNEFFVVRIGWDISFALFRHAKGKRRISFFDVRPTFAMPLYSRPWNILGHSSQMVVDEGNKYLDTNKYIY